MGVFTMTDDEQAISEYQALNLTQFDILDRFDLSQHYRSDRQHELSLELWLRMYENENDDPRRLRLSFIGVRDLKAAFQGFTLLPRIEIRSIHVYQSPALLETPLPVLRDRAGGVDAL